MRLAALVILAVRRSTQGPLGGTRQAEPFEMTPDELIAHLRQTRRIFRPRVKNTYPRRPARVATVAQLRDTESQLGFHLPPLLWRIYAEVGNGGFGPGYGLIGGVGGAVDDRGDTIVAAYQGRVGPDPQDPTWHWPAQLVPLVSWGGAVYTCGNFALTDCPLIEFDPGRAERRAPMSQAFITHDRTLHQYLEAWISGHDVMLS
jgi:hypothetical protein